VTASRGAWVLGRTNARRIPSRDSPIGHQLVVELAALDPRPALCDSRGWTRVVSGQRRERPLSRGTAHRKVRTLMNCRTQILGRSTWLVLGSLCLGTGCSKQDESGASDGAGSGSGGSSSIVISGSGSQGSGASSGSGATDFVPCSGQAFEQELVGGPLDIYLIFDRTASMGTDCAYRAGQTPPTSSKACFATYAISDYLVNVKPESDTRLAFQFMSLADNDCDGVLYQTPMVDLRQLPVSASDSLIRSISDETFKGGFGTHIEGALRGMSVYTRTHRTDGREMIGVLMTDGDPNGCQENVATLASIISNHLAATGIRTFIIGMEGATDANLARYADAGGAELHDNWCGSATPPCRFWNVGNGSGNAIASALSAIIQQASPMPCEIAASGFVPPSGENVDWGKVNVNFADQGATTTIGRVPDAAACPSDKPAWYYDIPAAPTAIQLCPAACDLVTSSSVGARVNVVVGCQDTVVFDPLL
jgi:hypothetical protein